MAEFDLKIIIQKGVEEALKEPVCDGKSIIEWAAIGMKASQWINVKDKLPETNGIYLTWCVYYDDDDDGYYRISKYHEEKGGWYDWTKHDYGDSIVRYWIPLPKSPTKNNER